MTASIDVHRCIVDQEAGTPDAFNGPFGGPFSGPFSGSEPSSLPEVLKRLLQGRPHGGTFSFRGRTACSYGGRRSIPGTSGGAPHLHINQSHNTFIESLSLSCPRFLSHSSSKDDRSAPYSSPSHRPIFCRPFSICEIEASIPTAQRRNSRTKTKHSNGLPLATLPLISIFAATPHPRRHHVESLLWDVSTSAFHFHPQHCCNCRCQSSWVMGHGSWAPRSPR